MKKTFLILFETPPSSDTAAFRQALKDYRTWARITKGSWAIVTTEKAAEVRDKLIELLPTGSRLMVVKSGTVAAWRNVICSKEWLNKHL